MEFSAKLLTEDLMGAVASYVALKEVGHGMACLSESHRGLNFRDVICALVGKTLDGQTLMTIVTHVRQVTVKYPLPIACDDIYIILLPLRGRFCRHSFIFAPPVWDYGFKITLIQCFSCISIWLCTSF